MMQAAKATGARLAGQAEAEARVADAPLHSPQRPRSFRDDELALETAGIEDLEDVRRRCAAFRGVFDRLRSEIGRTLVGQREVVDLALVTLFANGHLLLEGVPGLGKTLLVRSLASATGLGFSRIQFTPDVMPADITGTSILMEDEATGRREIQFALVRSSRNSSWPTKSIARAQRRSRRFSKRCKSAA
jgi:hypothetical protein